MPTDAEAALVARLRGGDEPAFEALVGRHSATMLSVAMTYVSGRAVADEVVQETWLAVVEGLDRFEGRSSLKTWILAILVNKAKTRGVREARSVPFAALGDEPAVEPDRFRGPGEAYAGHWREFPRDWQKSAAAAVEDRETLRVVIGAIA
ncbi:MAG TPA: sigma factor, partial [Solirubrobacteraceae bacterium]|nr:sigma factor [Solirubrobacteraceae bacterium]